MGSFDKLLRVGKEEILDEDLTNFEISGEFTLNTDNFNLYYRFKCNEKY